jgi:O-antigen/teichoic acid export membrane protein
MAFGIIITPFWSAFTEAYVKKDFDWIRSSIKNLIRIWLLFSMGILVMLFFADRVYELWVGDSVKVPFLLSGVLALYIIINVWCTIFSIFLNGVGKLRLQFYSGIFGALLNIPLALFMGKHFGSAGVVLSTAILGFVSAVWSPIQYYKIMNNTATGIWNK